MSRTKEIFSKLPIEAMWQACSEMKVDRDAFDQLTLQLATTITKIEKFEEKFEKIHSELAVTKKVNSVLKESLCSLQRRFNNLEQYGRRENIEVSGVPNNTPELEKKLFSFLKRLM